MTELTNSCEDFFGFRNDIRMIDVALRTEYGKCLLPSFDIAIANVVSRHMSVRSSSLVPKGVKLPRTFWHDEHHDNKDANESANSLQQ